MRERGIAAILALLALTLIPLAGCSPQSMAQSATATANAETTQVANPSPTIITPTLSITPTIPAQATVSITATASITATGVVTEVGTPAPRPTPTGEPPDPMSRLNIFQFFATDDTLVARDFINLDGVGTDEILMTISGVRRIITDEVNSGIGVLTYDTTYREWVPLWSPGPITGTTSPLPSANRKEAGGYNGGNLLGSAEPVLVARTTTVDGKAHLYLWRWNKESREGAPLKMTAPGGAGDVDAIFDADLDANVADIDDDGIYEVVLDNVAGVQVWKWDGTRFVLRGER